MNINDIIKIKSIISIINIIVMMQKHPSHISSTEFSSWFHLNKRVFKWISRISRTLFDLFGVGPCEVPSPILVILMWSWRSWCPGGMSEYRINQNNQIDKTFLNLFIYFKSNNSKNLLHYYTKHTTHLQWALSS